MHQGTRVWLSVFRTSIPLQALCIKDHVTKEFLVSHLELPSPLSPPPLRCSPPEKPIREEESFGTGCRVCIREWGFSLGSYRFIEQGLCARFYRALYRLSVV